MIRKCTLFCLILLVIIGVGQKVIASSENLKWQLLATTDDCSYLDFTLDTVDSSKIFFSAGSGLYLSSDKGSTWSLILSGFFRKTVIDPQNNSIIYTGPHGPSGYGLYKSIDGGINWNYYSEGMTDDNLAAMEVVTENSNIIYVSSF